VSQRLRACCCEANPCPTCQGLPQSVTLPVPPIVGIFARDCYQYCGQFPVSAPGQPRPFLPFTPPPMTAYLCTRAGEQRYTATPIFAGTIFDAYGWFSGPCKPVNFYYAATLYSECGDVWQLEYFFVNDPDYGSGFCRGDSNCTLVPNDFQLNPCGIPFPPGTGRGLGEMFAVSAPCTYANVDIAANAAAISEPSGIVPASAVTYFHQDIFQDPVPKCADPRATYYALDSQGNLITVQVT